VIGSVGIARRPLVEPAIRRSIGLVTRRDSALSPAAEAMLAMLREQLGEAAGLRPD
jgi:DNA-binding transcriptional LysR family regulator